VATGQGGAGTLKVGAGGTAESGQERLSINLPRSGQSAAQWVCCWRFAARPLTSEKVNLATWPLVSSVLFWECAVKILTTLAFACFLLGGCATNYATAPSSEVSKAIEIKDSSFDSDITYTGPQAFSETRRGLFVDNETVRLAAVKNKTTGAVNFAMYVRILYSFEWRFYNSVSFRDGKQGEIKNVSRQVNSCTAGGGCIHTEEFVFLVGIEQLRSRGNLEFRVNAKNGAENIISIPRTYIDGFLKGLPKNVAG
jgi:hypothetical protein